MAVTSLWPVKGRIAPVIDYAKNPEKTAEHNYEALASLHCIDNVVEYAVDEMKTECRRYVSCLNCREDIAATQFMETKRMWKKTGGRMCYHGYQSFRKGEVTAESAHEIGVALAQELWGDRFEVLVATHCNTEHYHNHFVINSVSFADGYKFYNSPADYTRMRAVSDQLCRAHAISVIDYPGKNARSYHEWQAEKNGELTHKSTIRADIDRAIRASTTQHDFLRVMGEMGYELKLYGKHGQRLQRPGLKPPDADGYFRFYHLGDGYDLEQIRQRILKNIHKQVPFSKAQKKQRKPCFLRDRPQKKITGLRALYFRYCYELHILEHQPTSVKQVSFFLRKDMVKLNQLDAEARLLGRHNIRNIGELTAYQEKVEAELQTRIAQRQEFHRQARRVAYQEEPSVTEMKLKIKELSIKIKVLRKEVKLCEDIALRSKVIQEHRRRFIEQKERELIQSELFRRRGRTGREDIFGR